LQTFTDVVAILPNHRIAVNVYVHIYIVSVPFTCGCAIMLQMFDRTFESQMAKTPAAQTLGLLVGTRQIALYVYGDEERWRSVYGLKKDLGLFRFAGQNLRPPRDHRRVHRPLRA
jgi:hypothetical protein